MATAQGHRLARPDEQDGPGQATPTWDHPVLFLPYKTHLEMFA